MKRSIEKLSHFSCEKCEKWWSIGDAPEERDNWFCSWCGHENNYGNDQKKEPEKSNDSDMTEKLFSMYNDIFNKQLEKILKLIKK
jgi:hypothetical protein